MNLPTWLGNLIKLDYSGHTKDVNDATEPDSRDEAGCVTDSTLIINFVMTNTSSQKYLCY